MRLEGDDDGTQAPDTGDELVTGVWPHERAEPLDASSVFPPGVRVGSVTVDGPNVRVEVMDPYREPGDARENCDMQLEALRRTLRTLPGLRDVTVTIEDVEPAAPAAEPDV